MQRLFASIEFIRQLKVENPTADKAAIQAAYIQAFDPVKARSVLVGDGFALRFSEARTGSFSNTVLSLSALKAYDVHPFVVVVVRPSGVDFMLANTTLLKKISHSSIQLRHDNIKGSFNGTDIVTDYEGVPNNPSQFDDLFARHSAFTWEENVDRLVEATNAIVGRDNRFKPGADDIATIMVAPERAAAALVAPEFLNTELELSTLLEAQRDAILRAALIDNVNLRGNAIEQLLTGVGNAHELGDLIRPLGTGRLIVDVKTKLIDRASAPKAYNIDKMLRFLAESSSVFAFFMVAVDTHAGTVSGRLLPILETALLDATGVQHHWAGRASRGVTQLSGQFGRASAPNYQPTVNLGSARSFLEKLLAL